MNDEIIVTDQDVKRVIAKNLFYEKRADLEELQTELIMSDKTDESLYMIYEKRWHELFGMARILSTLEMISDKEFKDVREMRISVF